MPIFPEVSKRVDHILRTYYKDSTQKKLLQLIAEANATARALKLDQERFVVYVDEHRIKQIVISYYLDVIRYKEYHFNPKPNSGDLPPLSKEFTEAVHGHNSDKVIHKAKVAAFTAKWILRYLPIYVYPKRHVALNKLTVLEKEKLDNVNFWFALDHSCSLIGRPAYLCPANIVDMLLYHFKYRTIDDRSLMLVFSMIPDK